MKQDYKAIWKQLANAKKITARHQAQYCILKAIASKADNKLEAAKHFIRMAFPTVTREIELANGRFPFDVVFFYSNEPKHIKRIKLDYKWTQAFYVFDMPANELLDEDEITMFNDICAELSPKRLTRHYSYFFTRQDIFEEYQLVQTAHVALELGNRLTPEQIKDLHFTVCGVDNLYALEGIESLLTTLRIEYVVFREPDIGNQKTAIGVYPIAEHKRGLLRKYKLLRLSDTKSKELELI